MSLTKHFKCLMNFLISWTKTRDNFLVYLSPSNLTLPIPFNFFCSKLFLYRPLKFFIRFCSSLEQIRRLAEPLALPWQHGLSLPSPLLNITPEPSQTLLLSLSPSPPWEPHKDTIYMFWFSTEASWLFLCYLTSQHCTSTLHLSSCSWQLGLFSNARLTLWEFFKKLLWFFYQRFWLPPSPPPPSSVFVATAPVLFLKLLNLVCFSISN